MIIFKLEYNKWRNPKSQNRVGKPKTIPMNEQNLPLISFGPADQNYNSRIIPMLGKIDNGSMYTWYFYNLLRVFSWCILIGGIFETFALLFGDDGYINTTITSEGLPMGKKIGSSIGLLIGLLLSILTTWSLYSIMKKRIEQINEIAFNGLLNYIFVQLAPKIITLAGEFAFIITLYIGLSQVFAAFVGASVYAPLLDMGTVFWMIPGMNMLSGLMPTSIAGDYNLFIEGIQAGLFGVIGSVLVLIGYYIYREIYVYALKLIINLLSFLPKFAIPLAIRSKSE